MEVFVRRPNIEMLAGVRVTKDTVLEFKNEHVDQYVRDLVLYSKTFVKGANYEGTYETKVYLNEGDILVYEEEGRGYVLPVEPFVSIDEAIDDLTNIKGVGEENVCTE